MLTVLAKPRDATMMIRHLMADVRGFPCSAGEVDFVKSSWIRPGGGIDQLRAKRRGGGLGNRWRCPGRFDNCVALDVSTTADGSLFDVRRHVADGPSYRGRVARFEWRNGLG